MTTAVVDAGRPVHAVALATARRPSADISSIASHHPALSPPRRIAASLALLSLYD